MSAGLAIVALLAGAPGLVRAEDLPIVRGVERQPLVAQARRVAQALDEMLGAPLSKKQQADLEKALKLTDADAAAESIQKVFDPLCLAAVHINPESRVKVARGPAAAKLMQSGWRVFLVKVHNEGGVTAKLRCSSPNAPEPKRTTNKPKPKPSTEDPDDHWLAIDLIDKQPLNPALSGLAVEYRILGLYSRDAGRREAQLLFSVGQGTQDLGFRNELAILFTAEPAVEVKLEVIDDDGKPTMGQFVIRDPQGRVYPSRIRRLAPDLFFHDQIYRQHGESIKLPPGKYSVTYTRGPEYRIDRREITVPDRTASADKAPHTEAFRLRRWIKLADYGWYSGDHHVHAAGCAHYEVPTQGVTPADMMRHILGEDLNVGCVLSWGPCWYHQKSFFSGEVDKLSKKDYLMRYDVEVSGFPSQHAGHLCLLRLKEDDYTYPEKVEFDWSFSGEKGRFKGRKTELIGEWPTWDLPILKWGKEQGAVVGFSHSGWGLTLPDYGPGGQRVDQFKGRAADKLPDYAMPPFDGIGANEFVVDTVHGVCDFISAVDTPSVWELNVWYHTLNCGFTTRISGETDFPCIYGERVGLGRGYVKLDKNEPLTYDNWVYGIRDGRSYCCDGLSHLFNFTVNGLGVGEIGGKGAKSARGGRQPSDDSAGPTADASSKTSRLSINSGEKLTIKVRSAAFLEEKPKLVEGGKTELRDLRLDQKPYWHVERARIGDTRKVPVELIVNGIAVEKKEIEADGRVQDLSFDYVPKHSSWVALRIFPACHTNPVFVEVDGKPIRASKKSADWCLRAVDVCWDQKVKNTRESEKKAAAAAYDVARKAYRQILGEAIAD
jgi:hypothetical protein